MSSSFGGLADFLSGLVRGPYEGSMAAYEQANLYGPPRPADPSFWNVAGGAIHDIFQSIGLGATSPAVMQAGLPVPTRLPIPGAGGVVGPVAVQVGSAALGWAANEIADWLFSGDETGKPPAKMPVAGAPMALPAGAAPSVCANARAQARAGIKARAITKAQANAALKAISCGPIRSRKRRCKPRCSPRKCSPRKKRCAPRRKKSCVRRRRSRCRKTAAQAAFARAARDFGGKIPRGTRIK